MRRLWILTVALCLLPVFGMQAQEYTQTPVTISKEKVRGSDGNVFYSHVVLERQTLFSISKAYGVTVEEIYDANPSVDLRGEGLKKNAIILIPVKESVQPASTPASKSVTAPQTDKDEFISHTVRWYEDINDIAAKYGVSVEVIMQANDLTTKKLNNRQKIRIPKDPVAFLAKRHASAPETEAASEAAAEQAVSETEATVQQETPQEEVQPEEQGRRWRFPSIFSSPHKSSVNTVLLLPMKNSTSMDFYSGFLMAVKEMGEKGIGSELSVYDVSGGALPVTASRLEDADVVIGPIAPADLTKVLNLADGHAAIVSPLDQKATSLIPEHRNLIQAPASLAAQYSDVIRWVREDRQDDDKVIVISERNGVQSEFFKMLEASNLEFTPFSYSILQGRGITTSLGNILSRTGVNRIILDSESEAFVTDVVRNLSLLIHNRFPVVVYSPSKVRSFDTIDVEYLHNVNLHVSMSYFIDYDSARVRDFLLAYRGLYGTEPNQFAFQGYDLASYFIQVVADHGDAWIDRLDRISRKEGLQADFQFLEAGNGGLVNHGIRRAVYNPDFSIKIAR
ncbi:MAG: LysM peptidoglycan-binding domain-containing protein [Bacteroidales bacterium]|nr:LysM peptidoglycan-binding domain-containing protein [Bacteroidales bacterium]